MSPDYRDRFERGGTSYDDAMARWPDARREELALPVRLARPRAGERLLDVPAGGGYLAGHLDESVRYVGLEVSSSFAARLRARGLDATVGPLDGSSVATGSVDVVVSLAGVHHEPDLTPLLAGWRRVLAPGGRLVLADVAVGSPEAAFLDGFVAARTPGGHAGRYLGDDLAERAAVVGLVPGEVADHRYHWWFPSLEAVGRFAIALFGLEDSTPTEVAVAMASELGIDEGDDGEIGVRWGLRALVAHEPEPEPETETETETELA